MKILYLTNDLSITGGVERILSLKINYFIRKFGYKVDVLTNTNINKFPYFELDKRVNIGTLLEIDKNDFFIVRQLKRIKKFYELLKILKNNNYDILITTEMWLDIFLPFLKKIIIIKEIHLSKYSYELEYKKLNCKGKIFFKIKKFFWNRYNSIVILTEQDKINWKLKNIEVIHNFTTFSTDKLPNYHKKKVIAVGRLDFQKGFDIIIDIWKSIFQKYPDWILEIIGEGKERKNLENKIRVNKLEGVITLRGSIKNVEEEYLDSSIYVMTSRYEGMPMVLLEAMSVGLPVVSFDSPTGPREIIIDERDGYLIPNYDNGEFVLKLEKLIKDSDLREKMGREAKKNVKRFSIENIMEKWNLLFLKNLEEEIKKKVGKNL